MDGAPRDHEDKKRTRKKREARALKLGDQFNPSYAPNYCYKHQDYNSEDWTYRNHPKAQEREGERSKSSTDQVGLPLQEHGD